MKKVKNNILLKNIFILLFSGAIAKIIGMIAKIIYTRTCGLNIVSLYALITPTIMLIISICQFSFPISISKLSAEEKFKNEDLLKNAYFIGFLENVILIIIILIFSKAIANLLHHAFLQRCINALCLIIPSITITSIQRGFMHGKEEMFPSALTDIIEEIVKLILIITILPYFLSTNNENVVTVIILFSVVTEPITVFIMNKIINKKYLHHKKASINKKIIKSILKISVPTTLIRLISSFGFFLEPIILTQTLINSGYSLKYITTQYGLISSYIIPLLAIPTFFSVGIASAMLPNITKLFAKKHFLLFKEKVFKLLNISLLIGVFCLVLILLFPKELLKLIFNITLNVNYVKLIGPFFIFLYIQPSLSVSLQAMGKTNKLLFISIFCVLSKYFLLYILGSLGFGINAFLISIIYGIITTALLLFVFNYKVIKKRS